MQAGLFNKPINLYRPRDTVNSYGERNTEWEWFYGTRAGVAYSSSAREFVNQEEFFAYTVTFTVRSYVPVSERDQIEFRGKRFRILTIEERELQNDKVIQAELINE